jgi:hypothetical protein
MKAALPPTEPDPRDPPIEPLFGQTYLFTTEEEVQRWLKANREDEDYERRAPATLR